MKEIKEGSYYQAKISGKLVTVRVDGIENCPLPQIYPGKQAQTLYDVTNLVTGRKITFRSAQRFRAEVEPNGYCDACSAPIFDLNFSPGNPCQDCVGGIGPTPDPFIGDKMGSDPTGTGETVTIDDPVVTAASKPTHQDRSNETSPTRKPTQPMESSITPNNNPHDSEIGKALIQAGAEPISISYSPKHPMCEQRCNQKLADQLQHRKSNTDTAPHVIVEALAGTGKTTTLIEGLKRVKGLPTSIEPSSQQAAIWEAMEQSKGAGSVCFVAFNKAIATELQERVPEGCNAMTMHSMGLKSIRRAFGPVPLNNYRVQNIIEEILETNIRELRRCKLEVLKVTEKLVGLCKMNLIGFGDNEEWVPVPNELSDLAAHYGVDLNGHGSEVFGLVPRVLERCKDAARDGCVDFNDMIWLPVVLNLNVYRYDLLLVDECQDLNRCQQALALKAGRRLILAGDRHQAIYGFAGADGQSMERMEQELSRKIRCNICTIDMNNGEVSRNPTCTKCEGTGEVGRGCITLPLTVTRRCGRAIVKEAQKYVPDFEAHESCGEGEVWRAKFGNTIYAAPDDEQDNQGDAVESEPDTSTVNYRTYVQDGDMILCRVNAPLVSECFKFLRDGRKAVIRGRDVGQGLISTIKKLMKGYDQLYPPGTINAMPEVCFLLERLGDWLHRETTKENAKRNPSEARLIALQDQYDCLQCFAEDTLTVEEVVQKIEAIFTDDKSDVGIMLSSIHKAKGLEAKRVFFINTKNAPCPHPRAKTPQAKEQESHLLYVAITRSIEELIYVS